MSELFEHIEKLKREEAKVAVATLVNTRGTTPRKEGAKMVVGEGGRILGSVTIGGLGGAPGIYEAAAALGAGRSRTLFLEGVRVFVEVSTPPAILLMVGAGHVSMPLATLGRAMGFRTVVIDGRPRFATRERFPDVDELNIGIPSELVREVPLVPTTALVLVAHDYKYDLPVLKHALQTPVGYIGLLGSSRRGKAILDLLREDGVAEDLLTRVRVPIGLDLGAQAAPEIALAVLAEVLAVQRGATCLPISEKVRKGIK